MVALQNKLEIKEKIETVIEVEMRVYNYMNLLSLEEDDYSSNLHPPYRGPKGSLGSCKQG